MERIIRVCLKGNSIRVVSPYIKQHYPLEQKGELGGFSHRGRVHLHVDKLIGLSNVL